MSFMSAYGAVGYGKLQIKCQKVDEKKSHENSNKIYISQNMNTFQQQPTTQNVTW